MKALGESRWFMAVANRLPNDWLRLHWYLLCALVFYRIPHAYLMRRLRRGY